MQQTQQQTQQMGWWLCEGCKRPLGTIVEGGVSVSHRGRLQVIEGSDFVFRQRCECGRENVYEVRGPVE